MFDPATAFWVAAIVAIGTFFLLVRMATQMTRSDPGVRRLVIGFTLAVVAALLVFAVVYFSTGGIILGM